jgi:hypothetical protein
MRELPQGCSEQGLIGATARLPIPPPFPRQWLMLLNMRALTEEGPFQDYLLACILKLLGSEREERYFDTFCMFAHAGRLCEFDDASSDQFLEEARDQEFSDAQLANAVARLLETLPIKGAWPYPAETFEFLYFVCDFIEWCHVDEQKDLCLVRQLQRLRSNVLGFFLIAVKREFELLAEDESYAF